MRIRVPWLTRMRLATLALVALIAGTLIVLNHRRAEARFLNGFAQVLPLGTALSADLLHDWAAAKAAQATMLARIAATRATPASSASLPDSIMNIVVASGGFHSGRLAGPTPQRAALAHRTMDDSLTVLDFSAPITRAGVTVGWVILSAIANEAAFSHFNVADTSDASQRTSLLFVHGDSVALLTSSGRGGRPTIVPMGRSYPAGFMISRAYASSVVDNGKRRVVSGIGRGLFGNSVGFARVPVPGTPFVLVRERDVAELSARIRPSIRISTAVFTMLTVLILGVTMALWRSAWFRRENESTQLRSTFVSSVSHELRTPLTQIRMYAEMLRLGLLRDTADSNRALGVIEKEAERLSMLVERALRMTRDGQVPDPAPTQLTDVGTAAQSAIATVTPLAAERHSTLINDVTERVQARIDADALHQVLLNLLDNAIKYGPPRQRISVSATTVGATTRLTVEDEGPGVPVHERSTIWRAFTRGSLAERSDEVGSGIGLAVVQDLVTRAGGRVSVESAAPSGQTTKRASVTGARFVIELPSAATE